MAEFGKHPTPYDERLVPLTQVSGGGPTQASICIDGTYFGGKLFVTVDGTVVWRENPPPRETNEPTAHIH